MISVITPSCRPEMLDVIEKCLHRQTYTDFEWIVIVPWDKFIKVDRLVGHGIANILIEPPKREGDFYRLCGAWNKGFAMAKGELIVNIQDGIWFQPDLLERFWGHYTASPKALVTAVGNQYSDIDNRGEPINLVWVDPRDRSKFAEVQSSEMEMCVCSIPKQALIDCGGIDEEYDRGPAVGEKELCLRLSMLGYKLFIDPLIEYKAIKHPRLTSDWDDLYWKVTAPMYQKHVHEIMNGTRPLNANCLMGYNNDSQNL